MRHLLRPVSFVAALALAACGGGGGGGGGPAAPSALVYPTPAPSYVACITVAPNVPTVAGNVASWSITPALPAGLAFDTSTGAITGTPTSTGPATVHTVTATGPGGSTDATVTITVGAPPAPAVTYVDASPYALVDVAEAFVPATAGVPSSWSVSPALPAGLALDPLTGVVSGTPTQVAANASFTVTAQDCLGGTANAVLEFPVLDPADLILPRFLHVLSADATVLTFGVRGNGLLRSAGHDVVAADPVDIAASWTTRHVVIAHGNPPRVAVHGVHPLTGRVTAAIQTVDLPAGSAPRRVVVDEARRIAWVSLFGANAVAGFALGGNGSLTAVPNSPFAVSGAGPTALALAPDGSRLLVANRTSGSVSVFTLGGSGTPIAEAASSVLAQPSDIVVLPGTTNPWVYVASDAVNSIGVYELSGAALANASVVSYGAGAAPIVLQGAQVGILARLWVAHQTLDGELLEYISDPATGALTNEATVSANGPTDEPVDIVVSRDLARAFAVFAGASETVTLTIDGSGSLSPALPSGSPTNRMRTRPAARRAAITSGLTPYTEVSDALYVANRVSTDVSQFAFDPQASTLGALVPAEVAATPAPQWVVVHPHLDLLYVSHDFQGPSTSSLSRFALAPDGTATLVATLDAGLALGGFHALAMDRAGRWLAASARLDGRILLYRLDAAGVPTLTGQATIGQLPTGVEISPNGAFLYAVANNADAIHGFAIDPVTGTLSAIPGSPWIIPACAQLYTAIHPSGRFLYVPCPGTDDLRGYEIDATTGALTVLVESRFDADLDPEHGMVSPSGRQVYVANRFTDTLLGYRVNLAAENAFQDGTLTTPAVFAMPLPPAYVTIDPGGAHIFVTLRPPFGFGAIYAMELDAGTGQVTPIGAEPAGQFPGAAALRTRAR